MDDFTEVSRNGFFSHPSIATRRFRMAGRFAKSEGETETTPRAHRQGPPSERSQHR